MAQHQVDANSSMETPSTDTPDALIASAREQLAQWPALAAVDSHSPPVDAARILASSEFIAATLERHRDLADKLGQREFVEAPFNGAACAMQVGQSTSDSELLHSLRDVRNREMVRIAWRDLAGLASIEQTLSELTSLAETLLDAALVKVYEHHVLRFGAPRSGDGTVQHLVVLALGKLGSYELNFSSDIDLIFAYPEAGETDSERSLSNEQFFTRVAQRLIKVLSERTEHGMVYRVDMRLRPFGRSGALVATFDQLETYYQTYGRDWERFALTRARTVAGDKDAGAAFFELIRPFIYRRYLDFAALAALREIKAMIALDLGEDEGQLPEDGDIKRGWGGIREIEFVVQAFQLLRGAAHPSLRHGAVLSLLPTLVDVGLVEQDDAQILRDAYVFLRTLENRLQSIRDEQTHSLPSAPADRARIIIAMGFANWAELMTVLEGHRRGVRAQFDSVLGQPAPLGDDSENADLAGVWDAIGQRNEVAEQRLRKAGFHDPGAVIECLEPLKDNYRLRTASERALSRVRQLVGSVLSEVLREKQPEQALGRVLGIIESVLQRTAYLALLTERPVACRQLVHLCAASPWLAQHMAQHPQTFDELLDSRTLYVPLEHDELVQSLTERLGAIPERDPERAADELRYFQHANVLRVAAAEISGAFDLMVVSDYLTDIAQTCLQEIVGLAWDDLRARFGEPRSLGPDGPEPAPFAIIAYGKFGGIELSYGSDLDLVFLHGSHGEAQMTTGPKVLDNATFFARLGQRIIHYLSAYTAAGRLYEVDSRLRPSGNAGLLVTSIEAFAQYQDSQAWTWEHQALVRARFVAGDAALGARFDAVRQRILTRDRDPETLRAEVRDMRHRQREAFASTTGNTFALKHDPGGIADIEFLVQYGALRWGSEIGEYLEFTDNMRLLDGFGHSCVMPSTHVNLLQNAYRAFRARVHELDLQELPAVVDAQEFAELSAQVREVWDRWMEHKDES
jgi:glutamate-ammonia-ligase adenylyltransferase